MWALTRLAAGCGMTPGNVLLARSGDHIGVSPSEISVLGQVPTGAVPIDDRGEPVGRDVLQDRRRCAESGVVVPVLALPGNERRLAGIPEIVTRGFAHGSGDAVGGILRDARTQVARSVRDAGPDEPEDTQMLGTRIQSDLRRFLRRRTRRQPLIVPVIVES